MSLAGCNELMYVDAHAGLQYEHVAPSASRFGVQGDVACTPHWLISRTLFISCLKVTCRHGGDPTV